MNRVPNWMYEQMIAHRGYFNRKAPENSLKAFQLAVDAGYAIELDVQMLKDQTLVVFHDDDLKRMTGHSGRLDQTDLKDVKALKLLGTEEKIPTFKEVLDLVAGQVPLMVEFKNKTHSNALERLGYDLLKDYKGDFVVQSFNPKSVYWFTKNAKGIVRGQLSCRHEDVSWPWRFIMRNVMTNVFTRPDYVNYDIRALDTWIIRWLKFRKKPLFGYTAKSLEDFRKALKQGVPAVFEQFDPKDL